MEEEFEMQDRNDDYDNEFNDILDGIISGRIRADQSRTLDIDESEMEYSSNTQLKISYVNSLYDKLSEMLNLSYNARHYDLIDLSDGVLSYKGIELTDKGYVLRPIKTLIKELGVKNLKALGFETITSKHIKSLPSRNKIVKATPEETIEMVDRTVKTLETSFTQTNDQFSLRELKGLDKSMQTISGSLKKAVAEKIKTEQHIDMEYDKLKELEKELTNTDEQKDEINNRITKLKDRLEAHNDEIKILKDKFSSQVTQIKETFKKLEGKSLGEKIRILFREQGITIATILTAIGMTIGFLIELLIPKSVTSVPSPSPIPPKPTPSWIKNKLEALKNLLAKLAEKAGTALPGIIGSIVSWILNRVKDVVGFIAKETWILVVGIGVILIESIRK